MKVSIEDLEATARLAQIHIPEDRVEYFREALSAILGYVEKLAEVDVSGVQPMAHAVAISMRLREDAVGTQLSLEEALSGVPRTRDAFIEVPRIIAHDKEAS